MRLTMAELLFSLKRRQHPELSDEELRRNIREKIDIDPKLRKLERWFDNM